MTRQARLRDRRLQAKAGRGAWLAPKSGLSIRRLRGIKGFSPPRIDGPPRRHDDARRRTLGIH